MRKTPNTTGGSRAQDPQPKRAPVSGVRTEHQLRLADLRRLKAVLWAAGFPDPSPRRSQSEDGDSETPVSKHP